MAAAAGGRAGVSHEVGPGTDAAPRAYRAAFIRIPAPYGRTSTVPASDPFAREPGPPTPWPARTEFKLRVGRPDR